MIELAGGIFLFILLFWAIGLVLSCWRGLVKFALYLLALGLVLWLLAERHAALNALP